MTAQAHKAGRPSRLTLGFSLGMVLGGVAAALVVPALPLRVWIPGLALAPVMVVAGRVMNKRLALILFSVAWFWLITCVVAAQQSRFAAPATLVLALGLALGIPAGVSGLRKERILSHGIDTGVIGGVVIILGIALGVVLVGPRQAILSCPRLLQLVSGCLLAYFSVRGDIIAGRGLYVRRAAIAGTTVALLSGVAAVGCWLVSAQRAGHFESRKAVQEAIQWAKTEEFWAANLAIRPALSAALHRQARLARLEGNDQRWRAALVKAVANDPKDLDAMQQLFRRGLHDRDSGKETVAVFMRLPDDMIRMTEAGRLLARCLAEKNWRAFMRAWRLCGGPIPKEWNNPPEWLKAGKALYFEGEEETAEELLAQSLSARVMDWEGARILCALTLAAGRPADAGAALNRAGSSGHKAERMYLRSLIARAEGKHEVERVFLEQTKRLAPGHSGCRRRLKEALFESAAGAGSAGAEPGIVFEGALRLGRCETAVASVRRGESLRVRFTWESLQPVNPTWRVFAHMRQPIYGGSFFRGDHRFEDVGRKPNEWAIGASLDYEIEIPVPEHIPTGKYSLLVGLWDGRSRREPAYEGGARGALTLAENRQVLAQSVEIHP